MLDIIVNAKVSLLAHDYSNHPSVAKAVGFLLSDVKIGTMTHAEF
jgi:hypothetical protein